MAGYTSKPLESGDRLVFVSREYGSNEKINIYTDSPDLCNLLGLTIKGASTQGFDAKAELVLKADDANSLFENTTTLSVKGSKITVSDSNDFKMVFQVEPGTVGSSFIDAKITASGAETGFHGCPNTS
jgi:flagellin